MVAIGDFGAGLTALEHNKIDIAIIPEPIYSQKMKAGAKYKIIPWLDAKLPPYTQTVGITTDEMIAKKGDKLRAVIEGRRKGVDFLYANQKEAAAEPRQGLQPAARHRRDRRWPALLKQTPTWCGRGELKMKLMDAHGRVADGDRRASRARSTGRRRSTTASSRRTCSPRRNDHRAAAGVVARLTDVSRIYPPRAGHAAVHALGPLSIELRAGEFFAVVGPSGCGKSTLLDVLAGLAAPTEGTVEFEGKPVAGVVPDGIGVVFQEDASLSLAHRARTTSPSACAGSASTPPRSAAVSTTRSASWG